MTDDRLTTKEGIKVENGQLWRDLDKRMSGRTRKVVALCWATGRAQMKHPTMEQMPATWVSIRRMHRHSTGWELVTGSTSIKESQP